MHANCILSTTLTLTRSISRTKFPTHQHNHTTTSYYNTAGEPTPMVVVDDVLVRPPEPRPRDLGVLVSIIATSKSWDNVVHTLEALRPRWCSLAVDLWNRPKSQSAQEARRRVYNRHSDALKLFDRVLFFNTATCSWPTTITLLWSPPH